MTTRFLDVTSHDLEDVVRTLPALLETLRGSYVELESRAERVEAQLSRANLELERRVHELDVLRGHLEAVLESMPSGVIVRDAEGRITRLNSAAARILGVRPGSLVDGREPTWSAEVGTDGAAQRIERAGSEPLVLAVSRADVRLADGRIDGSVAVLDDQTERAALQERLHAADKMAALGTLAAGIAHEIRNPLNAVEGFAALLRRRPDLAPEAERWAGRIVDGVLEVDRIIENLLSFGSPERIRRERVEPLELLHEAAALVLQDEDLRARVHMQLEADAPAFLADRIKLRQALRNLFANAVDVQPGKARVRATIRRAGDELLFHVQDAGPGIPLSIAKRILEPFFTTRADGTGLGLALVATLVRLHDGTVHVSTDPSPLGGAEIGFRIPYRPAPPAAGPDGTHLRP